MIANSKLESQWNNAKQRLTSAGMYVLSSTRPLFRLAIIMHSMVPSFH
jgi:L-rhamnose isomerase